VLLLCWLHSCHNRFAVYSQQIPLALLLVLSYICPVLFVYVPCTTILLLLPSFEADPGPLTQKTLYSLVDLVTTPNATPSSNFALLYTRNQPKSNTQYQNNHNDGHTIVSPTPNNHNNNHNTPTLLRPPRLPPHIIPLLPTLTLRHLLGTNTLIVSASHWIHTKYISFFLRAGGRCKSDIISIAPPSILSSSTSSKRRRKSGRDYDRSGG
jgi:hypothetical protein